MMPQGVEQNQNDDRHGLHELMLSLYDVVTLATHIAPGPRAIRDKGWMFQYCLGRRPGGGTRRIPVNVAKSVQEWVAVIRTLATAHDKDAIDQAEYKLEDLYTPLLTAPVKQLRQFYRELVTALEADQHVPFFIVVMFRAWGEVMIDPATDDDVVQLRRGLADEIANMVEKDVQPDLAQAIANALQWRSPETLTKVRDALKEGKAKPKLVGRESCLFLTVGDVQVML